MSALTLTPGNALIRVEAARILMALPFRAYQDVRYYFNGVCIQPATDGGANILATDGYAMACIRDIGGRCGGPAILPIGKAQKPQLRKGGHVLLDPSGVCYITDAQDEPIWIAPTGVIDGKFPDLTSILHPLDEYAEGLVGVFNPELLDRVRQCRPTKRRPAGVQFFHWKKSRNAGALCSLGEDGFVIVMGMRSDPDAQTLQRSVPSDYRVPVAAEEPEAVSA